jgi:single-stranded-DNA-specific exonuclease
MLKKRWTINCKPDKQLIDQFASETNIPNSLSAILLNRGINTKALAKKFFIPSMSHLYDPFLMKDMSSAVNRLLNVIGIKEKIMIFGDYDVDGTSGVSMFHLFLKKFDVPTVVYLPDRFTDGYGLSKSAIDHALSQNIKLIVTIDCGITANEKVDYAKTLGIEILICDHHQPPEEIPHALAVLDPLRNDCSYPFKYLCGTGVAFKLIMGLCSVIGSDYYLQLLDFVALATAADMVPVLDENRVMMHFGFKQIVDNPRPSYRALIGNSGFKIENLNTSNVVFSLGPRINAVGRLGDATRAVEFMTCEDSTKVQELAGILESENLNRRKIDNKIYIDAQNLYDTYCHQCETNKEDIAIILHNPEWHPGVLGIIASRMVEKYYRPAIILTTFNGHAKGSARSINNFNIYDALKKTSERFDGLIQFGGHFHAAGLEVDVNRIDEFRKIFNEEAKTLIASLTGYQDLLIPELKIDAEINLYEIDARFVKILKHFEPFGPENMTPLFLTRNIQIVGEPRVYNNSTYIFRVRKTNEDSANKEFFDCIFFDANSDESRNEILRTGQLLDIVYSVDENHWNGRTKTQLKIRDFKLAEKQ